jgi:hypothetical protein
MLSDRLHVHFRGHCHRLFPWRRRNLSCHHSGPPARSRRGRCRHSAKLSRWPSRGRHRHRQALSRCPSRRHGHRQARSRCPSRRHGHPRFRCPVGGRTRGGFCRRRRLGGVLHGASTTEVVQLAGSAKAFANSTTGSSSPCTTKTEHGACSAQLALTEPSSNPTKPP